MVTSSSWLRSLSAPPPLQLRWDHHRHHHTPRAAGFQNSKRGGGWRGPLLVIRGMVGLGEGKEGSGRIKYKGTERREKQLAEMIEKKVGEAQQICEGDSASEECRVAWDEVEEISQAKAHLRHKLLIEKVDPLHHYCQDNPETDECRVYDP